MARITEIDPSRPIVLVAVERVDDEPLDFLGPGAREAARSLCVLKPASAHVAIGPCHARELLVFLASNAWREVFERELQCVSETEAREPLLTGWVHRTSFDAFLACPVANQCIPGTLGVLRRVTQDLVAHAGASEIQFEGYRAAFPMLADAA